MVLQDGEEAAIDGEKLGLGESRSYAKTPIVEVERGTTVFFLAVFRKK